jgi:hypothetical protein
MRESWYYDGWRLEYWLLDYVQSETLRMQHVQAQLGVSPAAPAPHPDDAEDQCVLCLDAPKDHIIIPCYHMHVRVRGMCEPADADEKAVVPHLSRRYPAHQQSVPIVEHRRNEYKPVANIRPYMIARRS